MGGKEESGEEKIDDNERRGKGEEAGKVKEKEGGKTKRERECDFMMGGGEGVRQECDSCTITLLV